MKRLGDIVLSFLALLVLLPLMICLAFLVLWQLGSPVFFRQERIGLRGKPFRMIKFRTMIQEFDESGDCHNDAERLTHFGQILRATSLDELPELWNVIRGDMSFVGPRPLLPEYLSLYSSKQARRHDVRPGITGWAQVNGRNSISWPEKLELDVWYVDNRGLLLDIRILFMTFVQVFKRDGIAQEGHVTTEPFRGERD